MKVLAVVVLVLALVPGAAFAGASMEGAKKQIVMSSLGLVDNGKGATDYRPGVASGGVYDPNPNRDSASKMQELYKNLENLRKALATPGADRNAAWSAASAHTKTVLASMGITSSNWEGAVKSVVVLPRRVDGIKAIDHSRGGEASVVYETQNRPYTESYVDSEPIWGPIGCGCQGWQVVGYQQVTRTRVVYRPTQVAVASETPVVTTSEILTPYDGVKQVSTTRQVPETYYVSIPVTAPIGCGCQGYQVVGYTQEARTRMTTVVDVTNVNITAFEHHLPQKFSGAGNGSNDSKDNAFLAEGGYNASPKGASFVRRPTNDAGSPTTATMNAAQKQSEMATRTGNDDKSGEVINPNGRADRRH